MLVSIIAEREKVNQYRAWLSRQMDAIARILTSLSYRSSAVCFLELAAFNFQGCQGVGISLTKRTRFERIKIIHSPLHQPTLTDSYLKHSSYYSQACAL